MRFLDWTAIIMYALIMVGIGWYFSRRNKTASDYMHAREKHSWWSLGISLVATSVSATTFLGNPSESYSRDLAYLIFGLGSVLSLLAVNYLIIPRLLESGVSSAYELLQLRFSPGIRKIAALFFSCHLLLRLGILLYGPSLVISQMLSISIWWSVGFMALITIFYTWLGGFSAVIWTDVFQFLILMGGGILALFLLVHLSGGWTEVWTWAQAKGKLRLWDGTWNPSSARNILSAVFAYSIFEVAIRGCDQQFVQRYIASGSAWSAQLSSLSSVLWGLGVAVIFYGIGIGLYVAVDVKNVLHPPLNLQADSLFPWYILSALPSGLAGLLLAGIMAAAMSSLSSGLSALANTTMEDLLPGEQTVKRARTWIFIWGIAGIISAILAVLTQGSLLSKSLYFTSLFTGPLLALFVCALFFPGVKSKSLYIGIICGLLVLMLFNHPPFIKTGSFDFYLFAWPWKPLFSWPWNPLISLTGSLMGTGLAHLIMGGRNRVSI